MTDDVGLIRTTHNTHMGHRDQDGKKLMECHFFLKSEKLVRTDKSKN